MYFTREKGELIGEELSIPNNHLLDWLAALRKNSPKPIIPIAGLISVWIGEEIAPLHFHVLQDCPAPR